MIVSKTFVLSMGFGGIKLIKRIVLLNNKFNFAFIESRFFAIEQICVTAPSIPKTFEMASITQ